MSKPRRPILFFFLLGGILIGFSAPARAQSVEATISIEGARARVTGKFVDAHRPVNFSFLDSYAGASDLGARVSDVALADESGRKIEYRKLSASEYLAAGPFAAWSYAIDLAAPADLSARAHVTNVSADYAVLMLADLLPRFPAKTPARVAFDLPADWRLSSVERRVGERVFAVADAEKAVFLAGRNWREHDSKIDGAQIKTIITGDWKFSDAEAFATTEAIFAEYDRLFGERSFAEMRIFLARFPAETKFGRWQAETRGASVVLFSADMPFSTQSVQKLHEQLRHEMFHFWIPNGVNLSGNYDWFYEGFALYQSLRTAVAMNRIRFEDYLDTLGRAYDIDTTMTARRSLVEASQNRWTGGADTQIYARGMLVAFLVDVALLRQSKGRESLSAVLREIYRRHRPPSAREDGNAAVLRVLESRAELRPLVEKYVRGADAIDWRTELEAAGIEARTENFSTKLAAKTKPGGRQKDLLDKLGYNNWRKRSGN